MKKRKKFTRAKFDVYRKMRRHEYESLEEYLLDLLDSGTGLVCKTDLLNASKGMFWEGWMSGRFSMISQKIDDAFAELLRKGAIFFTPGQPLINNRSREFDIITPTWEDNFRRNN
ncbi:MAG: hypothetical protein KAS32_10270 [Candidatus Peribacteraceae bacterium]|nr:hypothetical protein [Candidatus Peribacteraceae bacterium]